MDPKELAALQLNRKEALKEAIEAGDKERALQYYEEFAQGKTGFHDFVVRWASMLLGYISEKMGDEAVHEVHQRFARKFRPPVITNWEKAFKEGTATLEDFPIEDWIRQRALMWNLTHDNKFDLEEDEEKFTLRLKYCQSGAMMQFHFPAEVTRNHEPYAWTGMRENFSHYCSHCTVMWEHGWFEEYGYPLILFSPPESHGAPCTQYFYKKPQQIPQAELAKRGLV